MNLTNPTTHTDKLVVEMRTATIDLISGTRCTYMEYACVHVVQNFHIPRMCSLYQCNLEPHASKGSVGR